MDGKTEEYKNGIKEALKFFDFFEGEYGDLKSIISWEDYQEQLKKWQIENQ
jgi:hypothetical protein